MTTVFDEFRLVADRSIPRVSGDVEWRARMGWRTISYMECGRILSFQIEPMFEGPDMVYLPTSTAWKHEPAPWARRRESEILERLQSIEWNRDLMWVEDPNHLFYSLDTPLRNSIEASPDGKRLESQRLFHPESGYSADLARVIWQSEVQKFADSARGNIPVHLSGMIANSVFEVIELPALLANPKVTLDYI